MTRKRLLFVGGDLRQIAAAQHLSRAHTVWLAGFDRLGPPPDALSAVSDLRLLPASPDAIILPMPVSNDGIYVNAPFASDPIRLPSVLQTALPEQTKIFGGRFSESVSAACRNAGYAPLDYAREDAFAIRNAVPTAEGAIQIALEKLPVTLHGLSVLILGAGRISLALQSRLLAFGAKVTVAARRCSDRARRQGGRGKPLHPVLFLAAAAYSFTDMRGKTAFRNLLPRRRRL